MLYSAFKRFRRRANEWTVSRMVMILEAWMKLANLALDCVPEGILAFRGSPV